MLNKSVLGFGLWFACGLCLFCVLCLCWFWSLVIGWLIVWMLNNCDFMFVRINWFSCWFKLVVCLLCLTFIFLFLAGLSLLGLRWCLLFIWLLCLGVFVWLDLFVLFYLFTLRAFTVTLCVDWLLLCVYFDLLVLLYLHADLICCNLALLLAFYFGGFVWLVA